MILLEAIHPLDQVVPIEAPVRKRRRIVRWLHNDVGQIRSAIPEQLRDREPSTMGTGHGFSPATAISPESAPRKEENVHILVSYQTSKE